MFRRFLNVLDVLFEVAQWHVFHSQEHGIVGLKPSDEVNKYCSIPVLDI